jgi:hypothetical protein
MLVFSTNMPTGLSCWWRFAKHQQRRKSHFERLEPNVYLYIQLKNEVKEKNLNKIAEKIGREVIVTLI